MRSDKHNNNIRKKKEKAKKMKRKDTITEDFLADFRNMEYSYQNKKTNNSNNNISKKINQNKKNKYKKNGKRKKKKWPYILLILILLTGAIVFAAYKFFDGQVKKLGHIEVDNSALRLMIEEQKN